MINETHYTEFSKMWDIIDRKFYMNGYLDDRFMDTFEKLARVFEEGRSPYGYMARLVITRLFALHINKRFKTATTSQTEEYHFTDNGNNAQSIEDAVLGKELLVITKKTLKPKEFNILMSKLTDDNSYSKIGRKFGITGERARQIVSSSIEKIKKEVAYE